MEVTPVRRPGSSLIVVALAAIALAAGCRAANGAAGTAALPAPPLAGTWLCGADGTLTGSCGGADLQSTLDGMTLAVRPGGDGADLWLDIACRCHLPLTVSSGDANVARLAAPTECVFTRETSDIQASVQTVDVQLDASTGALHIDLRAGATQVSALGACESSSISATLTLASPTPAECGPDASALGVIPYSPNRERSCPGGAGREAVLLESQDEDDLECAPLWNGWSGEGFWALPQATKREVTCKPVPGRRETHQPFCRIDGRAFKPLTTDPAATEAFYAVLKLSANGQPCPNGSVEMVRRMDTEDIDNTGATLGDLGPNQVGTMPGGTTTILHFCYFRWADSAADTMQVFPDLGFPYAVFHDFDGPQPVWATMKRWMYSHNEVNGSENALYAPIADAQAVEQFRRIVETPANATVFDIAWVR